MGSPASIAELAWEQSHCSARYITVLDRTEWAIKVDHKAPENLNDGGGGNHGELWIYLPEYMVSQLTHYRSLWVVVVVRILVIIRRREKSKVSSSFSFLGEPCNKRVSSNTKFISLAAAGTSDCSNEISILCLGNSSSCFFGVYLCSFGWRG